MPKQGRDVKGGCRGCSVHHAVLSMHRFQHLCAGICAVQRQLLHEDLLSSDSVLIA